MYPGVFDYVAATSVEEAVRLLGERGPEAKLLAGGHSLLPMMKLRLALPDVLIDLGRIPGMADIEAVDGGLSIGALTTYAALLDSVEATRLCPLLGQTVARIGDAQVRNRGTLGGAVAHADPAGDVPAAMLALQATFTAQGPRGQRAIQAGEFFLGLFATALEPDEVLTRIAVPALPARTGTAYAKFRNPSSGYAVVGVAATATLAEDGTLADVRVAITGAGAQPVRATAVEQALRGRGPDAAALAEAAALATEGLQLMEDVQASETYRAHLTRVYTRRALQGALSRVVA